jgi:hypothetical protein
MRPVAEAKRFDERDGYILAPAGAMTDGAIAAHAGRRRSSLPERPRGTINRVSIERSRHKTITWKHQSPSWPT